jgi:hypothetical protein
MANSTSFENSIRIVRTNRTIEVSKSFDKAASRFGTREYEAMQQVRKDYPDFTIVVKTVRTKADHFKGLTYDFMEKYIASHDDAEARMAEFNDLRGTSDEAQAYGAAAHSYGEIKAWFFKTFPEIEAFQQRRESALAA